jgi:hypothetical protein
MDRILKNDRFHRYSAYNPVLGTGIDLGIVAAYDAQKAFLTVVNPAGSPYWHIPEWLQVRVAVADTNSTSIRVDVRHDPTDRTAVAPGGTVLTSVDHMVGKPRLSPALIRAGAVTPKVANAGEVRVAGRVLQTDAAPAFDVGDIFRLDFDELRTGGEFIGPEVLDAGETLLIHLFGPGMAADAPDLEVHYRYRNVLKRTL